MKCLLCAGEGSHHLKLNRLELSLILKSTQYILTQHFAYTIFDTWIAMVYKLKLSRGCDHHCHALPFVNFQ